MPESTLVIINHGMGLFNLCAINKIEQYLTDIVRFYLMFCCLAAPAQG
jgi:hypothetical protein